MSGDTRFSVSLLGTLLLADNRALFLRHTLFTSTTEYSLFLYRALSNYNPAQHHLKMAHLSLNAGSQIPWLNLREKTCPISL